MNTLLPPEVTYIHSWDAFVWNAEARSFTGKRSAIVGFTGEYYDGEAEGLAIEGKSGQVLWFHVPMRHRDPAGKVVAWVLRPSCSEGAKLITQGLILAD